MHSRSFVVHFGFAALAVVSLVGIAAAQSTVNYRLLVDGAEPAGPLAGGTYNLDVQVMVAGNDLGALGLAGVNGGVLQYDFNVLAAPGLSFVDTMGGFIGGPDGSWDSTAPAAFTTHFSGLVDQNVDGTDYALFAEVGATSPGDINNQFQAFGSTDWSTVVSGEFTYDDSAGDGMLQLVPTLTGTNIAVPNAMNNGVVAANPDSAVGAMLVLGGGGPGNTAPVGIDAAINALVGDLVNHQFQANDAEGDPLTWSNLVLGDGSPANAPTLGPDGAFSWDSTGSAVGLYSWTATVSDGEFDGSAMLTVNLAIPEPATALLMGLAVAGLAFIRRR